MGSGFGVQSLECCFVISVVFVVASSILANFADFVFNVFDTDSETDTDPDGEEKPELRKQRITNNY